MNFLENIIVSKITHISIVNYKRHEKTTMRMRPWYGIAFSLGGELIYIHNSKKITLSDDQVVFIPQNSTYEVDCTKPGSFAVINFLTAKKLNINNFISMDIRNIDIFHREFLIMHKLFLSDAPQKKYENLSSLYKMLSMLINSYGKKRIPSVLNLALKHIDNNISSSELSNTQIAENVGISEVYLRKLFVKNLSTTVNQYIQNKRIESAKILLTETDMSITEISEKCGYSCIYYFCCSFKRKTGYTPSQYRNNNDRSFF